MDLKDVKKLVDETTPTIDEFILNFRDTLRNSLMSAKVYMFILMKHLDEKEKNYVMTKEIQLRYGIKYIRAYQILDGFRGYVLSKSEKRVGESMRYYILSEIENELYVNQAKETIQVKGGKA